MKLSNLFILFFTISMPFLLFSKTDTNTWIHFNGNVSIGEVKSIASKYKFTYSKILSNPFRILVCRNLDKKEIQALKKDILILKISNDPTTDLKDNYYSAFGWDKNKRDKWTTYTAIAVPTILTVFGASAWDWGQDGFHLGFGNEDWFSKNSYTGGADKVGHMTSLYIQKRLITWLSLQAGHNIETAQRHGLIVASFVGIALEVGDGFSEYKFSTEDLLMDSIGIGFAYLLDKYPALDELIGLRWQWWPSKEYRDPNFNGRTDISSDYNGQKLYLTVKAAGIPYLNEKWFSRYLTFDFGYFTRGYEPDLTPDDKTDNIRRRYFSYGIGLNLGTLIFDSKPSSPTVRTIGSITKYWIPPGITHSVARDEI